MLQSLTDQLPAPITMVSLESQTEEKDNYMRVVALPVTTPQK